MSKPQRSYLSRVKYTKESKYMAYSNNGTLATWTNLTNIVLNQRSHKRKITEHFHIQKVQVKAKKSKINLILLFIVTKVKIVITCREWHIIKREEKVI